MSLINDMLNDLEERHSLESRAEVDLSWFINEDRKPNLVEKPQFWVVGILLTAVAVSLFLRLAEPVNKQSETVSVPVEASRAAYMEPLQVERMPQLKRREPLPAKTETVRAPQPESAPVVTAVEMVVETAPMTDSGTVAQATGSIKKSLPLNNAQLDHKSFLAAQALARKGDKLGAEEELRRRLEADPDAIRSAELLASLLLSEERHRALAGLYQSLSARGVGSADLRTVMGRSLLVSGKPEEALQLMLPDSPNVFMQPAFYEVLALAAQRSGRYDLSSKTYQKLLQTDGRRGDWWMGLAIGFDQRKNVNAAGVAYQRALRMENLSSPLQRYAQERLVALTDLKQGQAEE